MSSDLQPPNPWLSIPAEDYEAHMSSPEVGQLQYLSEALRDAVERHRPTSVACLGCTTGNGFEHLAAPRIHRVLALDVNRHYLEILRERHAQRIRGLETVCADLVSCELEAGSFDLIWAALVLEYVDCRVVVPKLARWLAPRGVVCVVLQLDSPGRSHVTATAFTSLAVLEPYMRLVDPGDLDLLARRQGLVAEMKQRRSLAGKEFFAADYRKP